MTIPEEAGKVLSGAVDVYRAKPELLYMTLVHLAFLVFIYLIGTLVLEAYDRQQDQIHERYSQAIATIDRCFSAAIAGELGTRSPPRPDAAR